MLADNAKANVGPSAPLTADPSVSLKVGAIILLMANRSGPWAANPSSSLTSDLSGYPTASPISPQTAFPIISPAADLSRSRHFSES